VTLVDAYGNPDPGVNVTFSAPASGPSGTFPGGLTTVTVLTGANGVATAPALTADTTAGTYTVIATATGIAGNASFTLTNEPGAAASIVALAGSPQSVYEAALFPTALQVQVTDTYGNPLVGTTVTFAAPGSGPSGTFSGVGSSVQVTTDSKGDATAPTLTANGSDGPFNVTASVAGSSASASFALTVLAVPKNVIYVNSAWANVTPGTDPDGPNGPALVFGPGGDAFATIQDAANAVDPGGTIIVYGGTYSGPLNITKPATVQLDGSVTITTNTGGGDVVIGAAVTAQTPGGEDLTINAGGGNVTFTKPVGVTPLGNLTINGASNITFDGPVNLTGSLTETGSGTATFNGGAVGGNLAVTAANVTLASGTLIANSATLDGSSAVVIPTGTALQAKGPVVLDGGFNNPAGGSVTLDGTVTGSKVTVLGGPGNDTFTVAQVASPTTVDGGGGSNQLNVDLSTVTAAQTVYVTSQGVSSTALGAPLTYQDTGGTFSKGLNVTTGAGNDTVVVQSTAAGTPTVVNTGAGNDTIDVASTTNLAASVLSGLAGPLTIDAGPGANTLTVSDAGSTSTNAYFITGSAIGPSDSPNAIWFKSTGGNFNGGVNFVGGQASDTYVILGTFPAAPTAVYGQGGNDTFDTGVSTASSYGNLTLNGGAGANTLGVYDQSGSAVVNEAPAGAGVGQVKVSYLSAPSSTVTYQNMGTVGSNVSQATSLIQALYHVELGYNASPGDVNFWQGVLNGPGGQAAVVDGIDHSQPALTRLATSWYHLYLNRAPAGGEEQALVQRLMARESEETVLASLLASDEYANLGGGGDAGFVQRGFQQLLGRPATASEVSAYVNTLIPQVGRQGAAWLILTSTDHRRLAVVQDYQQLLNLTTLTQADIDYWALGSLDLFSIHEQFEQTSAFLNAQS
jgi:hypothetical protein